MPKKKGLEYMRRGSKFVYFEFDCPECDANNPYPDGFENGDEVFCYYCGNSFIAVIDEEGNLRLKPA